MKKNDAAILKVAQSLGYEGEALPRESLKEAKEFASKVIKKCPEEQQPFLEYAMSTLINTLTWNIAKRVIKEDQDNAEVANR